MMSETSDPWGQATRDRWFFAFLAVSTFLVTYLFSPFLYVLLFAAVTVVVTWPVYQVVLKRCKGRAAVASVLTVGLLGILVFGPITSLVYLFAVEAVEVVQRWVAFVKDGELETQYAIYAETVRSFIDESTWVKQATEAVIPEDFDPLKSVMGPLQEGAVAFLNAAGSLAPRVVTTVATGVFDAAIYVFAVLSLYMEGPRILEVFRNLSPMDDRYEHRLFEVFREFATNMVVGSLATAAVQGIVAGIGYAIAGVDGVIFFAIVTGVCSFVPIIGTLVVWLPLSIAAAASFGWGWGVFLAVWSLVFTGSVDNLLKPLFLRGSSNMHPLLIFLAVFGGMTWMGLPGVLIGPVIVAFFLALYKIYKEDYLGIEPEPEPDRELEAAVEGADQPKLELGMATENDNGGLPEGESAKLQPADAKDHSASGSTSAGWTSGSTSSSESNEL
jgi:predicted PurR-regulated permease PerM